MHKDGQFEVIVDRKTGKIITTPSNAGTFNYYTDYIRHTFYDVNPWTDFGSGNGDNTSYSLRKSGLGIIFGEFGFFDNKEEAIKKFQRIGRRIKK